jgi:voltage-gated potassium channel
VVVEQDFAKVEHCHIDIDYYIISNATQDDVLIEAGIQNAHAIIFALPDDADNLFGVLTARELNKNVLIVSRASKDSSMKKLKIAGADNVLMPDKLGGVHMATLVLSPDVKEFIDLLSSRTSDEFMIKEITATRSFVMHKAECWEKTGATILGIKKFDNEYILNPQPALEVREGWRLIVMGSVNQIDNLIKHISDMHKNSV